MSDEKEVADNEMAIPVAEQVGVPKRMLVIQTDGAKVNVLANTMGLWESKAILEEVHRGVCGQINQMAAQPAGVPPVKELLDESAVVEAEDEPAAAEAMADASSD